MHPSPALTEAQLRIIRADLYRKEFLLVVNNVGLVKSGEKPCLKN